MSEGIKKTDLKSNILKKLLKAARVAQRYHNKNKSGGNFGINIYFGSTFNRETDREITGNYNTEGFIYGLRYGPLYQCGQKIPRPILKNIDLLGEYLLYLDNGGDWLRFLNNHNLLEEYKKQEGIQ